MEQDVRRTSLLERGSEYGKAAYIGEYLQVLYGRRQIQRLLDHIYCNSRVIKFSPEGKKVLLTITNKTLEGRDPDFFQLPHSLSLDEQNRHLFVADRENSRVLVFDSVNGSFVREIKEFGDRVFDVHYHPEQGEVLHVVNGPFSSEALGFTFRLNDSTEIQRWKSRLGFGQPHDIASDEDGAVYVADMASNTVWKFKRRA